MKIANEAAWREAAAFGALWGALEVALGSFLHALRLPFTGLFLTCCGVVLLVAGRHLFPRRGFGLRAALICAGLKAFSPGGVIFGPMLAIMLEGLLLEASFLLLGGGSLAALLGGSLAALGTLIQFTFTRLLFYGASIFELYLALLERASRILHLELGRGALMLFLALVASAGLAAAALGLRLGREVEARISL